MKRVLITLACVIQFALGGVAIAENNDKDVAQKEYHQVTGMINWIKQHIVSDQQQLTALEKKVRDADNAISQVNQSIAKTRVLFNNKKNSLERITQSIKTHKNNLSDQQYKLGRHLRAIYELQQENHIKLLINREDPASIDRILNYAGILNRYYLADLEKTRDSLKTLREAEAEAKMTKQQFTQLIQQLEQQRLSLVKLQNNRQMILRRLNKSINQNHDRLSLYQQNKIRLGQVIEQLDQSQQLQSQHFKNYYHHMSRPTQGTISTHYGSAIAEGKLTMNGVIIDATLDTPVYAVAPGRVVFAKWLKGFGLLVIINHGHGYMTLYGRNNSLYHKVGDWVKQGEQIGSVGQSGGFDTPSLYFAIRYNGQPLNPERWWARG